MILVASELIIFLCFSHYTEVVWHPRVRGVFLYVVFSSFPRVPRFCSSFTPLTVAGGIIGRPLVPSPLLLRPRDLRTCSGSLEKCEPEIPQQAGSGATSGRGASLCKGRKEETGRWQGAGARFIRQPAEEIPSGVELRSFRVSHAKGGRRGVGAGGGPVGFHVLLWEERKRGMGSRARRGLHS